MAATLTDFTTTIVESGDCLGNQWGALVRDVQSLTAYFQAMVATGTEPNHALQGMIFSTDNSTRNVRRLMVVAGELVVQDNVGSEGTPSWSTIQTLDGTGAAGEANTASSAGGTESLVNTKAGVDLPFKGLTAGTNIGLTGGANDVTINMTGTLGEVNTYSSLGGDEAILTTKSGVDFQFKGITAGTSILVTADGTAVTVGLDVDGGIALGQGATGADAAALLELESSTQGFLPPRMTTSERDAISTPPDGLFIFNETTDALNVYHTAAWNAVGGGGGSSSMADGSEAAPGWNFTSDTNTGFHRSASGVTNIVADGTAIMNVGALGVAIGQGTTITTATAILELESSTQGFAPPRMTSTERDAIGSPIDGLMLYNETTPGLNVRTNGAWVDVSSKVGRGGAFISDTVPTAATTVVIALPTGYSRFILDFESVEPASDGAELEMEISDDSEVSYESTGYTIVGDRVSPGASSTWTVSAGAQFTLHDPAASTDMGNAALEGFIGSCEILPGDGTNNFEIQGLARYKFTNGNLNGGWFAGTCTATATRATHIRLSWGGAGGNFKASGLIRLWGVLTPSGSAGPLISSISVPIDAAITDIADNTGSLEFTWDYSERDETEDWFGGGGADSTDLIVPANVNRVNIAIQVAWQPDTAAGVARLRLLRNGTALNWNPGARDLRSYMTLNSSTAAGQSWNIPDLEVAAGDVISCEYLQVTGASLVDIAVANTHITVTGFAV